MDPHLRCSRRSMAAMKKPDSTRNMSTPIHAPVSTEVNVW